MTYDSVFINHPTNSEGQKKQAKLQSLNRKNNPQRGMRDIHVGVPCNSKVHLVYVPSMGKVYTSNDVYFDEEFNSTIACRPNKFSGYIDLMITETMPDTDLPLYQTGDSFDFIKEESEDELLADDDSTNNQLLDNQLLQTNQITSMPCPDDQEQEQEMEIELNISSKTKKTIELVTTAGDPEDYEVEGFETKLDEGSKHAETD
jgi:hypothetical protein